VSSDAYTQEYDLDLISELRRDAVAGRVVALCIRSDVPQHPDDLVLETPRVW